jgi:hypothetical protein
MRRLALVLIALAPATSAFALNPQPEPPSMPAAQGMNILLGDGSVRVLKLRPRGRLDAVGLNPQPLPPKLLLPAK